MSYGLEKHATFNTDVLKRGLAITARTKTDKGEYVQDDLLITSVAPEIIHCIGVGEKDIISQCIPITEITHGDTNIWINKKGKDPLIIQPKFDTNLFTKGEAFRICKTGEGCKNGLVLAASPLGTCINFLCAGTDGNDPYVIMYVYAEQVDQGKVFLTPLKVVV